MPAAGLSNGASRGGAAAIVLAVVLMAVMAAAPLPGPSRGGAAGPGPSARPSPTTTTSVTYIFQQHLEVTNAQPSPVPSPFDLEVVVNSLAYESYEASNLQNVEFTTLAGAVVPSWIESGASSTATSTVYWLRWTGGIPAGGSVNLSMDFASPSTRLFDGVLVGEAPTLSPSYGEYDNGRYVFPLYDNFAGPTLNTSLWSVGPSTSARAFDGLTVAFSGPNAYFGSVASYAPGEVFDVSILSIGDLDNIGFFTPTGYLSGYHAYPGAFVRTACGNTYPDQMGPDGGEANTCGSVYGVFGNTESIAGTYEVQTLSSTSAYLTVNGAASYGGAQSEPVTTDAPSYPVIAGIVGGGTVGAQWALVRPLPPNGVMPSVRFIGKSGVLFSESGLPSGRTWGVTFNSTLYTASAGSPIEAVVYPGTYSYTISDVSGFHQTTLPYRGTITVNDSPVTEPTLEFLPATAPVTFSETGLPAGTAWAVTVNGVPYGATAPASIRALVPNGTFAYQISDVPGWHQSTLPYSGNGTMSGSAVNEPALAFARFLYVLRLQESGLPTGTEWGASVNGTRATASAPAELSFDLPNGTFPYLLSVPSGWVETTIPYAGNFTVAGSNPVEPTLVFLSGTGAVTFTETGLPVGATWAVVIDGALHRQFAGDPISVSLANGPFTYAIVDVPGYHQTTLPYVGSGTVDGGLVFEPTLRFVLVGYNVTVIEYGLPAGTPWSVTLNGSSTGSLTNDSYRFVEPNGTYGYTVANVPGWRLDNGPYRGNLTVNGASVGLNLTFSPTIYAVEFQASGLNGESWSMSFGGYTSPPTSHTSIDFTVANGTYPYRPVPRRGWQVSPDQGEAHVQGSSMLIAIVWHFEINATFRETGLPVGTPWEVTVNATYSNATRAPGSFSFSLWNGTYTYAVAPVPGYSTHWAGAFAIHGTPTEITVAFVPFTYRLTFNETGLPGGRLWQIALSTEGTLNASAPGTISVEVANGSYPFFVPPVAGYNATPKIGAVGVDGRPANQTIVYTALPPASGLPSLTFPTSPAATALLSLVAVVPIVGSAVVLYAMRRVGRPPVR